ncbi:MAG: hypothetical protein E5W82_23000 [Mesorhizobium sp.]|uniref:hypothetical protein n=1 Tax=Mesorhizobium sp. TaxID=1871066 RepID=UPI001208A3A9|nr:hypothetical protein [Mesorhizobium sp.]TIS55815.1 MAG: hypothetical protein E5W91_20730 [Mesorhizobium sp.]TIS89785.1 MAG: hypothetical protein E5W89_14865 [Mesorhizobium sp.]TJW07583.1 MAG: hypothetical protein E5W82_23000 [Mesorhizobium sp.]TJW42896.1 MAG: hypothetical protein E5W83_19160 [Mesorhizobium sp.]
MVPTHVESGERDTAIADRGYFDGNEILACAEANITVTLPKRMTCGAKAGERFGKQDLAYLPNQNSGQ